MLQTESVCFINSLIVKYGQLLIEAWIDGSTIKYLDITLAMPLWKENFPDDHIRRFKLYENNHLPVDSC